jgi:hypothetical protein
MARMSHLARLSLTYADGTRVAPSTLIAKLPGDSEHALAIGRALRVWEIESLCYRHLLPTLDVAVPRCYYAGSDPEAERFALLLEDLKDHQPGDQVAGADLRQANAGVIWLARFHAAYWGRVDDTTFPWIPRALDRAAASQRLIGETWPQFCDTFGDRIPQGARAEVERAIPTFADAPEFTGTPTTIAFGDYRVDNLMFAPGTFEASVVDWQTPVVGPGMVDLGYFLAGGLPSDLRRRHERELVASYGRELAARGVDVPEAGQLFGLYSDAVLRAATTVVLTARHLDKANERGLALSTAMVDRAFEAVEHLRVRRSAGAKP